MAHHTYPTARLINPAPSRTDSVHDFFKPLYGKALNIAALPYTWSFFNNKPVTADSIKDKRFLADCAIKVALTPFVLWQAFGATSTVALALLVCTAIAHVVATLVAKVRDSFDAKSNAGAMQVGTVLGSQARH